MKPTTDSNLEDITLLDDTKCHLATMLNKILVVQTTNGGHFSARLTAIKGNKLYFQNRAGDLFIDNLDDVKSVRVI